MPSRETGSPLFLSRNFSGETGRRIYESSKALHGLQSDCFVPPFLETQENSCARSWPGRTLWQAESLLTWLSAASSFVVVFSKRGLSVNKTISSTHSFHTLLGAGGPPAQDRVGPGAVEGSGAHKGSSRHAHVCQSFPFK